MTNAATNRETRTNARRAPMRRAFPACVPAGLRIVSITAAALAVVTTTAVPSSAQDRASEFTPITLSFPARTVEFSPYLITGTRVDEDGNDTLIHGFSRKISPRWTASYGYGLAEETDLTSSYLRYDHTLAYGTRTDRTSRENWRHFLGLEYSPIRNLSVLGGIAKSSGMTGSRTGFSPSGYERLRLNAGVRWTDDTWGVDAAFSFIPTGAGRVPGDAHHVPGMGNSEATYFGAVSIFRRF